MKVKFLPIMISAVLAGGGMTAAAADVTVMGHIDTSIDSIDIDGGSDDINMNCTTCSVGFKGSEDLGNGLKAVFKLDFQYDTTERNKTITDRDQWLGLKGNFGQVRAGTISTGYKSHGAKLDPLYRTALQGRSHGLQSHQHLGAGEELEGRATNTIRWDSPSWNGVNLVAHYTIDNTEGDGEDENPYGIGASYKNGGIFAFADYMDNQQSGSDELSAWKVGGMYSMDNIAVMAQYENIDGDTWEQDVWHVAGSYTMGSNMVYLGYGQGDTDNVANDDYDAWTLALMHSMSKRTKVYVGFSQQDCGSAAEDEFGSSACDGHTGEKDQFSLGMKHKF